MTEGGDPFRPPGPSPRLGGKVAIVVGAGQTPGETIGNGRATAVLFAAEGARLVLVDRDLAAAQATEAIVTERGGEAVSVEADVTDEDQVRAVVEACLGAFGRIDILHNNVGIGTGDLSASRLDREVWDRIFAVNVTGAFLTAKHAVPVMREQEAGVITNVSSVASLAATSMAAYKASKAALNALTHHLAMANARYGIRANAILPGLMETPMAMIGHSTARGIDIEELRRQRNAAVPLRQRMGTGWDTAYAALWLASDEARFVTGVLLPVDGGQLAKIG